MWRLTGWVVEERHFLSKVFGSGLLTSEISKSIPHWHSSEIPYVICTSVAVINGFKIARPPLATMDCGLISARLLPSSFPSATETHPNPSWPSELFWYYLEISKYLPPLLKSSLKSSSSKGIKESDILRDRAGNCCCLFKIPNNALAGSLYHLAFWSLQTCRVWYL